MSCKLEHLQANLSLSFLESQGIVLHNLAPQVSLNPHFPPPYCDAGVVPLSGQCMVCWNSANARSPPTATATDRAFDHPRSVLVTTAEHFPNTSVLQHGAA